MKKHAVAILILLFCFAALVAVYGRIIIDGDGLSYYALTVSLAHDHDFDLTNQKQQIQSVMAPVNETTGKPASLFSCGFGVLYAPALLVFERVPFLADVHPYPQNARIPFAHALAVFVQSLLFGLAALLIACSTVVRRIQLSPAAAAAICLGCFAGTPLLFYTITMPSYSHAADAFLVSVVFSLALSDWKHPLRALLTGFALALSVMLRNNNVVFWPAAAAALVWSERPRWIRQLLLLGAGALPAVLVHAAFNVSQYGKLLTTGYRVQTETGFLAEMLFHPYAGLFVWAPVTALALLGLAVGVFRKRKEAIVSLVAVLLVLLSVQFQGNWWGGCSFGPRFFAHLFFFWVIGLSQLAVLKPRIATGAVALCALWTFLLFNIYLVNAGSVEGRKTLNANNCRRTPAELFSSARAQYAAAGSPGYLAYWKSCLSSRPYPTLWFLSTAESLNSPRPSSKQHPSDDARPQ